MVKQVIILSGHVSSGKTTLARSLEEDFGTKTFKTRQYLDDNYPEVTSARGSKQKLGDKLDRSTKGEWVRDGLLDFIVKQQLNETHIVVVDAVRIRKQINAIRIALGSKVVHIHLDTPLEELTSRYKNRPQDGMTEFKRYKTVQSNPTERQVGDLAKVADFVVNTKLCTEEDVKIKAASHLGLYGREYLRLVDVLIGGQYGSEGKGNIADHLAPEYGLLVRVGGPNAGHKVYARPEPYNFHHLPSGCCSALDAKILIGPGATIYIPSLMEECGKYNIDHNRLSIDVQAMIITKKDRADEKTLVDSIGSTGQGVGAANARRIRHRKPGKVKLARDYPVLKPYLCDSCEVLENAFHKRTKVFLEGTQGTGLSLYHGHYPHVTSRDTTVAGCLAEAGISPSRTRKIIMVCRTYPIRVESPKEGDSGWMANEIDWGVIEDRSKIPKGTLSISEHTSTTNKLRRVGEFEWTSLRKAASLNAPTDIALTFVDYINKKNKEARRFEQLSLDTIRFIEEIERVASAPVSLISTRFDHRNIIDRRAW